MTGSGREVREGMGEIGLGTLTALPVPFLVRAVRTGSLAVLGALAGRARMAVTAGNGAISAALSVVEVGAGEEGWVTLPLVLAIGVALGRGFGINVGMLRGATCELASLLVAFLVMREEVTWDIHLPVFEAAPGRMVN